VTLLRTPTSFLIAMTWMMSSPLLAASAQAFRVEQDATTYAKTKVTSVLQRYCGEACELISVDAAVDEASSESEELGFESVAGDSGVKVNVSRIGVEIQVDDRVTAADQERLGKLIVNTLKSLSAVATVRWTSVAFPQIGVSAEVEDRLKAGLQQRIHSAVQQTIDNYCPQDCILTNVGVDGKLVSPDEARGVAERELVRERGGRGILKIENIDIDLSIDQKLSEANRTKIYNVIKAKTKFAFPVNVNVAVVDFPETQASKTAQDPWGLDRLRQTLQIFRDLASTKEIITNTSQNNSSKEAVATEKSESKESKENSNLTSKEKSSASEKAINSSEKSAEINASEKKQGTENTEYMAYIAGFLVLSGIIIAMIMKFASASRDARIMMESVPNQGGQRPQQNNMAPSGPQMNDGNGGMMPMSGGAPGFSSSNSRDVLSVKMKIEYLREELLKAFTDNPKVARDTFTRMLQEEGVEQTSKYVHLFGPMIIFDMMNDPNLQRDLYDLSEYYYKATFAFTDEMTLELLNNLKTKVTASEIRVMSRKRSEQFDFLQNMEASQIFSLISEEKPHVQSVVLTQLDHSRRRTVFDMYEGETKVALMRELCKADAIPKEYLANVAKALHKKVRSRTEFDTEQLRSSDIIIDLLEKSSIQDQRALMADLVNTNPEAARAIKLKLVTVEMLPYIKDGHLLEIVMGLERDDLLAFLIGSPDHIKELLLAKAPSELAQSWMEDMEQVSGIEEGKYRLAEMRILGRVRNLANSGAVRLVDINERIFAPEQLAQVRRQSSQVEMALSRNSFAA
jgi:flagellar motor switch protein FliG